MARAFERWTSAALAAAAAAPARPLCHPRTPWRRRLAAGRGRRDAQGQGQGKGQRGARRARHAERLLDIVDGPLAGLDAPPKKVAQEGRSPGAGTARRTPSRRPRRRWPRTRSASSARMRSRRTSLPTAATSACAGRAPTTCAPRRRRAPCAAPGARLSRCLNKFGARERE